MKRVHIDFAPRTIRSRLYRASSWTLVLLGVSVFSWAVLGVQMQRLSERQGELAALQEALAARASASAPPAPVAPAVTLAPAQIAAINEVIGQLNLPWRDLGDALAEATPASIALLSLEPDARRRVLRLGAEARTSDEMLAYVARLQQSGMFRSVTLTRHEINERDPNRPLRFQLSAAWEAP